ncbi:TonB-dependent receptor [Coralloluteibacterium stylophorae]|uniref:TonB-dependent receptor n=2 Tax=Coralloluteibacterium stylophorae TaxID=1776034 RepID=A0AAP2CBT4_9GAMM|nr:TonB-dependent receptor [Coralloluteibacterium stylophorae]MBS7456667.1 TonB-dependent receptor [Coralloluteibacterium stylophorae]
MMNRKQVRLSRLSLGLLAALAAAPSFAQQTSAGLGGVVTDGTGAPVSNAQVTILHAPSGTTSNATTDASGRYSARGLRVGGPYTVTIVKNGQTEIRENVYLNIGDIANVSAQIGAAQTLDAITVVGTSVGSEVFSPDKMGTGTDVNRETIETLPSANANIQDYMRLDPRVAFIDRASGSISAGGQNPRYNAIRIDGVSASDTFGLEGNNMPTRRQPVAMEAIEAINVDLANYDVTITGATGAVVDAVTKSGTNEFHGSVYGTYRDGDWFGSDPDGDEFNGFTEEENYGVTLGGPLVKDRLFFFANYDKFTQSAPGVDLNGTALGQSDSDFTLDDVAEAQQIAQEYGFDAGTLESDSDTDLEEYALKLDWNISDNHRASLRYSNLEQSKLRINGTGTSTASLSSYWYQHDKTVESYVGQLFSDWTDTFSTEFKASYRDYSAVRVIPTNAPSVRIYFGGTEDAPSGDSLYLGTETNSQANVLQTETWDFFGAGTLTLGDHDVKFGADYSSNDIYNLYGPQVFGVYTFYGLDNFRNGIWDTYNLRTPQAGESLDSIAAVYKYEKLGLFVQDQWYVNNNLTLTFGLRADRPEVADDPQYNDEAYEAFGYDNSEILSGDFLIQPRFGFNYMFDTERPTQLRGGFGLFQGESPQVWLSNSFSTTGYNYIQYQEFDYDPSLAFDPDGGSQPVPADPASQLMNVNFTTTDLDLPSVWKANLAFDHELPWNGVVASAELLVTEVKDGLYYRSLNLGDSTITGQDGRDLFWNPETAGRYGSGDARYLRNREFGDVYLLDNTDEGSTRQMTVSLSKPASAESDWSWTLGYTYTDAEEVGTLTSSTAGSGWGYQYAFNANDPTVNTARYEIKDRLSGSLSWKHAFFGDYETSVGLFYEGRSGRPYSFVYGNDMNGDGRSGNDLFYVPAGPGDVLFGSFDTSGAFVADPEMEAEFFEWLNNNPDLARYAGRAAPANSARADWVNLFDVRISQELPGFFAGHKSEIWLDIQNVGNLINSDWGHVYDYGFYANNRVADMIGIVDGKYVYDFDGADDPSVANSDADGFDTGVSQWSAQIGFRYRF